MGCHSNWGALQLLQDTWGSRGHSSSNFPLARGISEKRKIQKFASISCAQRPLAGALRGRVGGNVTAIFTTLWGTTVVKIFALTSCA